MTYQFVFVENRLGHEQRYFLIETNVPLSSLSYGEYRITRDSWVDGNSYISKLSEVRDSNVKLIKKSKTPIEGYLMYYGKSGNY